MKLWHTAGSTALITGRSRGRADDQQDESFQEPDLFDEISAKLKSSECMHAPLNWVVFLKKNVEAVGGFLWLLMRSAIRG
jgi:hypothetical protein